MVGVGGGGLRLRLSGVPAIYISINGKLIIAGCATAKRFITGSHKSVLA